MKHSSTFDAASPASALITELFSIMLRLKATTILPIIEKHYRVVPMKEFSISASLLITMDMRPRLNGGR